MRNKARFQYVDQFRKINCLQKLHPIANLHLDDEEDAKQDNNKFIRYKQEIMLEEQPRSEDYLYNPIIDSYKLDIEADCNQQFVQKINSISADIDYYKNWSESLNHEIKARDYRHKFYFKDAQPPPRLKKEEQSIKEKTARGEEVIAQKESTHEDTNIQLPQKGKYNFHEITKHLYANNNNQEDKDNTLLRDLTIKNQISELRKLKNLYEIEKVGEFNEEFGRFTYYVESQPQKTDIEYVDNSIVRGNNTLTIDYFRDIGTPSRRLQEHIMQKQSKMKFKEKEEQDLDLQREFRQQNRELLYLYFLKEEELKINKSEITFFDMANMSMGRITSNNAHMCVRNEKVTKAQYNKLVKKMEKYDLRENEAGKPKVDRDVGTEELEEIAANVQGGEKEEIKDDKNNIEKIIEEINRIRKEVKLFEDQNSVSRYNRANFNNEVYSKLEKQLTVLYDMVTDKMQQKYSLGQIGQHLQQIEGSNQLGYDRLRILWFVANVYDEMLSKQQKTVDLRNIGTGKPNPAPQVIKYKGKKVLAQQAIQTKKIYGFNVKDDRKNENNRSKSPIITNRTPVKSNLNKSTINRTPTKNTTATKLNISQQNTAKKYPLTAKK